VSGELYFFPTCPSIDCQDIIPTGESNPADAERRIVGDLMIFLTGTVLLA
jgi:hypothetical protein